MKISTSKKENIVIPFLDIKQTHLMLKKEFEKSFSKFLNSGSYILGSELINFENSFANFCNTRYCIGVGNGLEALFLSLKALDIKEGDEVIVPAYTFIATILAVTHSGAKPIFVDINKDSYNLDPQLIEKAINNKTKAIIPVHLFGQPCEMDEILSIVKKYNLFLIEDNAQAQGANYKGKITGSFGDLAATSFYPTKNIGALGDGGAITTNNKKLYDKLIYLRNYGSIKKYYHEIIGYNSRLDELQATFLSIKLKHLSDWNKERQNLALFYDKELNGTGDIKTPVVKNNAHSVYHLYVIQTQKRDNLKQYLSDNSIQTGLYYPMPNHLHNAYKNLGYKEGDFPVSESLSKANLAIPIYPGLRKEQQKRVIQKIKEFYNHG